ncbi:MAG: NADAR family protein [Bacteroidota bacterium]
MQYNNEWLKAQLDSGERIKYLFFWGDQPNKDGSIGKSCLSQWFRRSFEYKDIVFPTAEHWMMAEKALLFEDQIIYEQILVSKTAAEAKKLGRQVRNFEQTIWEEHRTKIVIQGNYLKFRQHQDLWAFLDNTKSRVLVEASPVDRIWGIGRAANSNNIENPETWKGLNLLGYVLMEVRDRLRRD